MKNFICDVKVPEQDMGDAHIAPKLNWTSSRKTKSVTVQANSAREAKQILEDSYGSLNIVGTPIESN